MCGAEDSIQNNRCSVCHTEYRWVEGRFYSGNEVLTPREMLHRMEAALPLWQKQVEIPERLAKYVFPEKMPWRVSQEAILRQARQRIPFRGFAGLFRREVETPRKIDRGVLLFFEEEFRFVGEQQVHQFPLSEVTCVTTNSHYFEFKLKHRPVYQIEFQKESALKYELLFKRWLREFYRKQNREVVEFQPVLRWEPAVCHKLSASLKEAPSVRAPFWERMLVRSILALLRHLVRWRFPVQVRGITPLPREYPFILLVNHQSIIDPFLILAFLDARIAFLTKSTSFVNPLARFFLKIGRGIPTTRYQTDPTVYHHVRQALERNIPVGIFPEGERCWDGEMQRFKMNVVRLLCYFAVPVVPVTLQGVYRVWPRWKSLPEKGKVIMQVGAPFCLNHRAGFTLQQLQEFLEEQINPPKGGKSQIKFQISNPKFQM